jgi:uroporphyrinogen decarboxylase
VVKKVKALRDAGADMIAYANPLASATFITASQFDELAAKWISRDFEGAGPQNLVYFSGGGKIGPLLDRIMKASGAGAYYLSPIDDITAAKKKVGSQGLVVGAINDIKLLSSTREQIRAAVKKIMDAGKPGGGFLFGTLMMPYKIPEENIRIMIEAAHEYGQYEA